MAMELEFRALLTGDPDISALAPARQINWVERPQDAPYPALVLTLVGQADGKTQQGPDGLWRGRVQVDCYALTYGEARALADAVIAKLNGFRGGGFQSVFLDGQRSGQDKGSADRPSRISMDFLTAWRESNG